MIRSLLAITLSLPSDSHIESLPCDIIAHSLTALAQHALTAESFQIVIDEVVNAGLKLTKEQDVDWNKFIVVMRAVESVVGVKKGARVPGTCFPQLSRSSHPLTPPFHNFSASRRSTLFSLLTPLSHLIQPPSNPPSNFLQSYTSMTVGVLLLAGLQDILSPSSGAKVSVQVLFSPETASRPVVFRAACALTTALDEAGWNLFGTAIIPFLLSATERYLVDGEVEVVQSKEVSVFDAAEREVSNSSNALILVARLAWSGRLREVYQIGGTPVKTWENVVGQKCEGILNAWTRKYGEGLTTEEEVSSWAFFCFWPASFPC